MQSKQSNYVHAMVECAMLIAVFSVLSRIVLLRMPQGGSLAPAASIPLVLIGYRRGWKWAAVSACVVVLIDMVLEGFYAPPAGTLVSLILCLALDYFVARVMVAIPSVINALLGDKSVVTISASVFISQMLYFACVVTSGVLLWAEYAPEGMNPFVYSLTYNASYAIPEAILTSVVAAVLFKAAPSLYERQK